jgi:putative ABC transport system substrate-binding protein
MMSDNDPVGFGFVTSLADPGGNITGLTNISGDLGDKRLELQRNCSQGVACSRFQGFDERH